MLAHDDVLSPDDESQASASWTRARERATGFELGFEKALGFWACTGCIEAEASRGRPIDEVDVRQRGGQGWRLERRGLEAQLGVGRRLGVDQARE